MFPTFVTTRLPPGLVGLIIAAIFAAAMSATAGELSATASATIIDIYRRLLRPGQTDAHYLFASRVATAFWGAVACVVAHFAVQLGSLIEVVNRLGSIFYGSLLGVFVLALGFRRANGTGAFVGLIAGIITVLVFAFHPGRAAFRTSGTIRSVWRSSSWWGSGQRVHRSKGSRVGLKTTD